MNNIKYERVVVKLKLICLFVLIKLNIIMDLYI